MSTETSKTQTNEELVRRYFAECVAMVNSPRRTQALDMLSELLTPDFAMTYNNDSEREATRGRDRHRQFLKRHASVYKHDTWTIEALVADEARVCCEWRFEATHAPTGNRVEARAGDFFTVRDGRLAELRRFLDFKNLDAQTSPTEP